MLQLTHKKFNKFKVKIQCEIMKDNYLFRRIQVQLLSVLSVNLILNLNNRKRKINKIKEEVHFYTKLIQILKIEINK
jgi:hypothetical protein